MLFNSAAEAKEVFKSSVLEVMEKDGKRAQISQEEKEQ